MEPTRERLVVRDLRKRYSLGEQVVDALAGVDLTVEAGEYVSVMGPSGSGKSTLMNILGCLDQPTSGTYELSGRDLSSLDERTAARVRRQEIGFVFQTYNLLPRSTAFENVELPLIYAGVRSPARRTRVLEALAELGLSERVDHLPSQLSGGQQQRVAIARSLINEPRLVLADEPTGNLDSRSGADVLAILARLHEQGITIVMVTHSEEVASHGSRTLWMRDGQIERDRLHDDARS
jgi:putative ABC transport system ATP-binding protein